MPKGLARYQKCRVFHFPTFSCYHRQPLFNCPAAYDAFEHELETVRARYRFVVAGYVLMPEHVHLLIGEPVKEPLSVAMQVLKQKTSRKLKNKGEVRFWQARYYDFNVWSEEKRVEKLRYVHRNPGSPTHELCALGWKPVVRGLVAKPEDWQWSSFRHYATGVEGLVEIESQWTAAKRERIGLRPIVHMQPRVQFSRPSGARTGAPHLGCRRQWLSRPPARTLQIYTNKQFAKILAYY
jgi:putative transposase